MRHICTCHHHVWSIRKEKQWNYVWIDQDNSNYLDEWFPESLNKDIYCGCAVIFVRIIGSQTLNYQSINGWNTLMVHFSYLLISSTTNIIRTQWIGSSITSYQTYYYYKKKLQNWYWISLPLPLIKQWVRLAGDLMIGIYITTLAMKLCNKMLQWS